MSKAITVTKTIWVRFQKEGIHCYPDAPEGVATIHTRNEPKQQMNTNQDERT